MNELSIFDFMPEEEAANSSSFTTAPKLLAFSMWESFNVSTRPKQNKLNF